MSPTPKPATTVALHNNIGPPMPYVFGPFLIGLGLVLFLRGHVIVRYEVARQRRNRFPQFIVSTQEITLPVAVYTFAVLALVVGAALIINASLRP